MGEGMQLAQSAAVRSHHAKLEMVFLVCDVVSAARLGAAFGEAWVSADRCVETTHATANQDTTIISSAGTVVAASQRVARGWKNQCVS